MKSRTTRSKTKAIRIAPAIELTWSHVGTAYRVTAWPEVQFERLENDRWVAAGVGEDALVSGMLQLDAGAWRRYLEFTPVAERTFVEKFRYGRLAALLITSRCPQLVADLSETPALVPFLAAHASLRGMNASNWDEVAAVHELGGVFGLLEWLGLPASRQTFVILGNLVDPDVSRCLLEPLRTLLWKPVANFVLQRSPELTDQQLAHYCHALAA